VVTPAPPPEPPPDRPPALALLVVRHGELPAGGDEVVAECGGLTLLIGDGLDRAAASLAGLTGHVYGWEIDAFQPRRCARLVAPMLAGVQLVLLPDGPDGRDLAPLLAHHLARPYLARCVSAGPGCARRADAAGHLLETVRVDGPFVATLRPGCRGVERTTEEVVAPIVRGIEFAAAAVGSADGDPVQLADLAAEVATMELTDAARIIAVGAGIGDPAGVELAAAVGERLGAALGATRVVTDRGWVPHERQIGTTGVAVDPRLYVAIGISGAVQHTAGLGRPDHVVAVNTDPSCPMMAMADLAVVADGPAVLEGLARLLGVERS
jgi:electron transfer flavoprotein alpha subunit